MDILKKIITNKLLEIKQARREVPLEELKERIKSLPKPRDFKKAISKKNKLCIIAEIKKASPSAGIIRKDFNPVRLAQSLERAGADALSVLTDKKFFKGNLAYINRIKAKVKLPLLRKDFLIDEYQVYESRANGSDAILLIVRILSPDKLKKLYRLAKRLGMANIVEVYSRAELTKALGVCPDIIGINNRNLKNFSINLSRTLHLHHLIPRDKITISESGIRGAGDLRILRNSGVNVVLIGERLMRMRRLSRSLRPRGLFCGY